MISTEELNQNLSNFIQATKKSGKHTKVINDELYNKWKKLNKIIKEDDYSGSIHKFLIFYIRK